MIILVTEEQYMLKRYILSILKMYIYENFNCKYALRARVGGFEHEP